MKLLKSVSVSLLLFMSFLSSSSFALTRDLYPFRVVAGEVAVTPAMCSQRICPPTTARIAGTFIARIPPDSGRIFFTSSKITTDPDVFFQMPGDPNKDSDGVTREISFTFAGNTIKAKGFVDSRAFDGPLVEYSFIARVDRTIQAMAFFTARPDFRKCVSPLCGGYFVKAVNKKLTRCADGSLHEECYVAELVYNKGSLSFEKFPSNNTPLLLRGAIEPREYAGFGNLGIFTATAAYRSATQQTTIGHFYGIINNGIVCITTPCFSYDETLLNRRNRITKLSDVNLEISGASPDDIAAASALLANGRTLYAAGSNQRYRDLAGVGVRFVAQQFYLPIKPARRCAEGYSDVNEVCSTPYGCVFPEIELTGIGGAAIIDPVTGEVKPSISKSCINECTFPGSLVSPGQCHVYYP